MRHEHKGIDIEEVRTVQNRPTIIEINNNLPSDFLLGHSDKLISEPYPGSGVALRQTIIYRHTSGHSNPHIFRAVSTENTKPQVLSAAVRPPDEAFPEAARLTAAYNLQATRHRKVTSADYRFPTPQCKFATLITHYEL